MIVRHSSQKIIDSRETGRGLIGELTEIGKVVKGMAPIAMENSAPLLLNIALGGAGQRLECLRLDYIIAVLSGLAGLAQPLLTRRAFHEAACDQPTNRSGKTLVVQLSPSHPHYGTVSPPPRISYFVHSCVRELLPLAYHCIWWPILTALAFPDCYIHPWRLILSHAITSESSFDSVPRFKFKGP